MWRDVPVITDAELCISNTCYLSRKKDVNSKLLEKVEGVTFHSFYYRIFKSAVENDPAQLNRFILGGDNMWGNVEIAAKSIQPNASYDDVGIWYRALREHQNKEVNILTLEYGKQFIDKYLDLKSCELDWEESAQIAKYLLANDRVKSLYDFYYDSIIIADFEQITDPSNNNTLEFLREFCRWNQKYGRKNIYCILGNDTVIDIQILNEESPIFTELFKFNTASEELDHYPLINFGEFDRENREE